MPEEGGKKSRQPIDKGYAWFCALAGAISWFLVAGMVRSNGILYVEFLAQFDTTPATAAFFMSITFAVLPLAAPLSVTLSERYSSRFVVMLGALFGTSSALISSIAPNIYFIVSASAICNGFFYGFMLVPTTAVMFSYFEKRRTLANGIAMAGGSLGQMVTPVMLTYWFKTNTFRATLLCFACLLMQGLVAGALVRPASFYARRAKPMLTNGDLADKKVEPVSKSSNGGLFLKRCILGFYDSTLFAEPLFYVLIAATTIGHIGYLDSVIFIAPLSHSLGISKDTVAVFLLVMGAVDFILRLAAGWFADLRIVEKRTMLMTSMMIIVITTIIHVSHQVYWTLVLLVGVLGVSGGVWMACWPPVLAEFLGVKRFSKVYAVNIMIQGVLNSMLPTIFGKLSSVTGDYRVCYVICACMMTLASGLIAITPKVNEWTERRKARQPAQRADSLDEKQWESIIEA